MPHAGTDLSRCQAVDQRQKLLKEFYAHTSHTIATTDVVVLAVVVVAVMSCCRRERDRSSSKN